MSSPAQTAAAGPTTPAAGGFGLPRDIVVLADAPGYLLYAPLLPAVTRVNGAALRCLQAGGASLAALEPGIVDALIEAGLLVPAVEADRRAAFADKGGFDPDGLTLFLTTRCSLACTYCYANGGVRPMTMGWDTARTAIDFALDHAAQCGRERMGLMFHGGGEVTTAWPLLVRSLLHAREGAAARGLKLDTSAGINGVLSGPRLDWLLAHIDCATVSLDGLPAVHDAQRPLRNGRGSFERIAANLRRMDAAGYRYGLRATVTRAGLPRLPESVDFLCRTFATRQLHAEPAFAVGRGHQALCPDPVEFVRLFREAREIARGHGGELKYSGARFGTVTNRFCQVSDDLFAVTPLGHVSACYEIGDPDDPRAATFFYGFVDGSRGTVTIDEARLQRLRTLTVEHKPACASCFCRFSCGGECASKLAQQGDAWDPSRSVRCHINRELTRDQICDYLERAPAPGVAAEARA